MSHRIIVTHAKQLTFLHDFPINVATEKFNFEFWCMNSSVFSSTSYDFVFTALLLFERFNQEIASLMETLLGDTLALLGHGEPQQH